MASHAWLILAVGAAILWGIAYALSEKILKGALSPAQFLAFQGVIALPLFFFFAQVMGGGIREGAETLLANKTILIFLIIAALCFVAGNICIFTSVQLKNAALANIIEISYPFFTVLFTWLLFREFSLNPATIIGGILVMAGTGLILWKG